MGNSDQVNELFADVKEMKSFLLGDSWHEGFKQKNEEMRKTVYLLSDRMREIERHGEKCNLTDLEERITKVEEVNKNRSIKNNAILATIASIATALWQWERITNFFTGK